MESPIADRRIELARRFSQGYPRPDAAHLRFCLGTSISDLRIPFHAAPEVVRIFAGSGRQLALMLLSRHRVLVPAEELDPFLLSEEFGALPTASPLLSPTSGGADVRAAAFLAFRSHPALTGGVLAAWLGPGGGGRSLVAMVIELLRKGFAEQRAGRGIEDTPLLTLAMLLKVLPTVEGRIRDLALPRPLERNLRGATSVGLYLALRLGVDRAAREAAAPVEQVARLEALLSPAMLLGSRAGLLGTGVTLYGLELSAGLPFFDTAVGLVASGKPLEAAVGALAASAAADEPLARRMDQAVSHAHLRQALLHVALLGEQHLVAEELTELTRELSMRPPRLAELIANEKARKELGKQLEKEALERSDSTRHALGQLGSMLKNYKEKTPLSAFGVSRQSGLSDYSRALLGAVSDLCLERSSAPLLAMIEARTGSENEGGLEGEYAGGRLYQLSVGPAALLQSARGSELGHLFVDVKDFTRRTSLLGQVAIADFLRREFYLPILNAAKQHFGGMSHLEDKGGITINNLLGDALSLSGGIEALVMLARDIRRQLRSYELQLQREVSTEVVAAAVRTIEQQFEARRASASTPAALAELGEEKELALSRARGEGLEAGVFVSFGPAPLVITFDDEIFGRSRVAIADRINESARGTARSGGARARADALLTAERTRRQNPALNHPWSVFVGAPFSIPVPVAAEDGVRAAIKAKDLPGALAALERPVKDAIATLARTDDRPGDIYNAGAALSEEALHAYRVEVGGRRTFRDLELDSSSFAAEIQQRYFLPRGSVRLVASFDSNRTLAEVFRFAGKVMFKGLEKGGGINIWELVNEAGIGALLAKHHAAAWWKG